MFIRGASGVAARPKLHTYQEGYLLPVLSADELLSSSRHKGLLRLFRDLAGLSENDFNVSYGAVLQNFIEFVQVIPQLSNGVLGGLLNHSLSTTSVIFQKYCQLKKEEATPLLKFAVFTAALLKNVAHVLMNQRIVLVDENGDFQEDWNPFAGALTKRGKFYKIYPVAARYLPTQRDITLLLARQLIPADYFLWLSQDPVLFADWLAALLGEEGVGAQEISLIMSLIKREDLVAVLNVLEMPDIAEMPSAGTEYGEAFYRWLKQGIEDGSIPVNTDKANVHVVSEGVLLEKTLFKQFTDLFKLPVNFLVVYYQTGNLMGIAKKGGADYLHAAYFSPTESTHNYAAFSNPAQRTRNAREGMVVDASAVFINKQTQELSGLQSGKPLKSTLQQSFPEKVERAVAAAMQSKVKG